MSATKNKYPLKVIFAEDDLPSRVYVSTILKSIFEEVVTADNGKDALELFQSGGANILVSDVGMPLMNGIDLSRNVKRINPNIPIILTTAFDNKSLLLEAIEIGISQYVVKPIQKDNLLKVLEKVAQTVMLEIELAKQQDKVITLSNAIEHSMSMVMIFDRRGVIEYVNPKFSEFTGISSDSIIGRNVSIFKRFGFEKFQLYAKAIENGQEWNHEAIVHNRDGRDLYLKITLSPVYSEQAKEFKFVQVTDDITSTRMAEQRLFDYNIELENLVEERTRELTQLNTQLLEEIDVRRAAEQDLIQARDTAESANKAKSLFLAKVSHELRTPMNGILGMTSILLHSNVDEKQRRALNIVKYSGDSLLTIINDILDWSKIETGKLTLDNKPFNLKAVIDHTFDILYTIAASKGLDFRLHIDKTIPDSLIGDANRVQQVLINLLGNAIKFTEEGYVELSVQKNHQFDSKIEIQFAIRDTGLGIPREKYDELFKSFSQIDNNLTRKYGGTGLGLAISKEIVEMMNGKISVESIENEGSVFYFSASFLIDNEDRLHSHPIQASKLPEDYEDFNLKVLIAEDSMINQQVIIEMLSKKKCDLTVVNNGRDAADKFQTNKYDVVLMDIQMPIMDGIEATKLIRAYEHEIKAPRTPIICLTAHDEELNKIDAIKAGSDYHLVKPFDWLSLYSVLEKIKNKMTVTSSISQSSVSKSSRSEKLNLNNLLISINNNTALLIKLVDYFKKNNPTEMEVLQRAIETEDYDTVHKIAHKMKSEFGNFYAHKAVSLLKELEAAGKNLDLSGSVQVYEAFAKEAKAVIQMLDDYVKSINK